MFKKISIYMELINILNSMDGFKLNIGTALKNPSKYKISNKPSYKEKLSIKILLHEGYINKHGNICTITPRGKNFIDEAYTYEQLALLIIPNFLTLKSRLPKKIGLDVSTYKLFKNIYKRLNRKLLCIGLCSFIIYVLILDCFLLISTNVVANIIATIISIAFVLLIVFIIYKILLHIHNRSRNRTYNLKRFPSIVDIKDIYTKSRIKRISNIFMLFISILIIKCCITNINIFCSVLILVSALVLGIIYRIYASFTTRHVVHNVAQKYNWTPKYRRARAKIYFYINKNVKN